MLKRSTPLLLLGCAALLNACESCDRPSPTSPTAKKAPMEIRTDLPGLEQVINLPRGARSGRWTLLPMGSAGLGPSDYVVYAYIELDDEGLKALEQQGGTSAATLWMPEDVARALLPARLHPSTAPVNGSWPIEGYEFDAQSLGRMPYQGDEAVRVASGVVVTASTR